jgi:hypothetical protein
MGYRGLVVEQNRARELRAQAWTLLEIATELGVAKSSVSVWVRDVEFEPRPRVKVARRREPNALQRRKQVEIDELLADGRDRIGRLAEKEFLVAGTALYAGEGAKTDVLPDSSIRTAKHIHGCPCVVYSCSRTHRAVMGLVRGLLACPLALPG